MDSPNPTRRYRSHDRHISKRDMAAMLGTSPGVAVFFQDQLPHLRGDNAFRPRSSKSLVSIRQLGLQAQERAARVPARSGVCPVLLGKHHSKNQRRLLWHTN